MTERLHSYGGKKEREGGKEREEVKDLQKLEFELAKIDCLLTICWQEHDSALSAGPGAGATTDTLGLLSTAIWRLISHKSCWDKENEF